MCRENLFTSFRLLQRFLSLYTWEKITFPLLHSPAGPVRAPGKQLPGMAGGQGSAPLHPEQSPGCSMGGFSSSCKKFLMPSSNRWVGKGQNPRCGKGWRWDSTGLQGTSEGDRNNMRGDRRKEITWFEEDHAAPTRNWNKVRMWWMTE